MGTKPKVDEILQKFVSDFIVIFVSYFDEYHKRLVERIRKKGKISDNLDGASEIVHGAFEIFEGPIKAASLVIFEVFRKTAGFVGSKCNRDDLKKFSTKLREYKRSPNDLIKILVESGAEIFRSFESQFARLSAKDNSWETAMEKVAEDVVNRILHHLKNNPEKDFSVLTILEGVLFGESKSYKSPNSDLPNMHKGHSVIIGNVDIKTSELFKKVGLLRDGHYYRYNSKSWSLTDLNRCGFRLLYTWEDVSKYSKYTKLTQAPADTYTYALTNEVFERVQNDVLEQAKIDQVPDTNLESILEDMRTEASKATEELVTLLKQNADSVKMISEEFNKIHKSLEIIHEATSSSNILAKENQEILLDLQEKIYSLQHKTLKNEMNPVLFDILDPTEWFAGRKFELERLDESLQRRVHSGKKSAFSQMTCVSGLGGIGKSELARRYVSGCRRKSGSYSDFIWINAEDDASLTDSFMRLAEEGLDIPILNAMGKLKDIKRIVKEVYESLSGRDKCLCILDNAENQEYLRPFLPLQATDGNLPYFLLTSRDSEWDKRIEVLHLGVMLMEESVEFVKNGWETDDECKNENIEVLVETLQYFPLAIQQAISYIIMQREVNEEFTVGSYLKEFNDKTQKLLNSEVFKNLSMDNTYSKTTFTTWNVTVDKILSDNENGKLALDILNLMAYVSPDNIHREMFYSIPDVREDDVKQSVRLLVKYSMARGELNQSVLKIHRLVQQVTRIKLDIEGKSESVIVAVKRLLESNIPKDETSESYKTKRKLLPHLEAFYTLLKDWITRRPEDEEKIERTFLIALFFHIADACSNLGKSLRAKQAYEGALAIVKKRNGKDDLITAAIVSESLCPVLDDLGEYKEQLTTIAEALPILEEYYNGDSRFAKALEKKAAALAKLGEYDEAEEAYKRILSIHESSADELVIAITKLNLSGIYGLKKDFRMQKSMLQEVLPVFEKSYESDHIKLASARFQLASVHRNLGDFDTAIKLIEECMPVFEHVYGEGHQTLARLLLILGDAYGYKGDREKDRKYTERAFSIFKNHYRDEHHIEVARCMSHLADVIGDSGDKREHLRLLMSALADYEKFHEGGSWETAYLLVRVAAAHDGLGQRGEAKKSLQRAINMMENHQRDREEEDRSYINELKHIISSDYNDV